MGEIRKSGGSEKTRIDALTGLRFLAALGVFFNHMPQPDYFPKWLSVFLWSGYNGVTIFFVLSGFVLALNYLESMIKPSVRGIISFFTARFARVYPLYLLALLFVWLSMGAPHDPNLPMFVLGIQAWSSNMFVSFGYNGPAWSVSVEFFLYACFPILAIMIAYFGQGKKRLWLLAAVIIATLFGIAWMFDKGGWGGTLATGEGSAHRWLYRMPLSRLGDFSLGIIGCLLYMKMKVTDSGNFRGWGWITGASLVGIIILMAWPAHFYSSYSWDISYASLAFLLILGLALFPGSIIGRLLSARAVVMLGEASFAFYLMHKIIIDRFNTLQSASFEPTIWLGLWMFILGICIFLAIGLNVYLEAPIRRHINRWAKQLVGPA